MKAWHERVVSVVGAILAALAFALSALWGFLVLRNVVAFLVTR